MADPGYRRYHSHSLTLTIKHTGYTGLAGNSHTPGSISIVSCFHAGGAIFKLVVETAVTAITNEQVY